MKKKAASAEALEMKLLTVFIESTEKKLAGDWHWEMHADSVYCSDVMLALPVEFVGTKGIIHPEDLNIVKNFISDLSPQKKSSFQFRIITTYGQVKTIASTNIYLLEEEVAVPITSQEEWLKKKESEIEKEKEFERLQIVQNIASRAERQNNIGLWYINTATNETWYSDQMFRLHGLPPQSLNSHPNTFASFIHPEDAATVKETIDNALKQQLPLQLEYRIVKANGEERWVRLIIHWEFNKKGQLIVSGILQGITDERAAQHELENLKHEHQLQQSLNRFVEQNVNIAYWYIHLLTRKVVFSDNFYRIYGIKPNTVAPSSNFLINYVHPDDREAVLEASRKIKVENCTPELDYRIIRQDGKIRSIRMKGKAITYANKEMVMIGTIQDVTITKATEKKINELNEGLQVQNFAQFQSEEMAGMGSWLWEIDTGKVTWSNNLYQLLGFKPNAVLLTQEHLHRAVHPEDRKKFKDSLELMLKEKQQSELEFRIIRIGEILHIKAWFRMMQHENKEYFIGTVQNITNQRQLSQQFYQRIHLAEALIENIPDAVFVTDNDNNIILWNKKCEDLYQIKTEAALNKNYFDLFPTQIEGTAIEKFNRVLKGEAIHEWGQPVKHNRFEDVHMLPLRDEEENILGILHVHHDITKEADLSQSLKDRLSLIEGLVENSVDRIIAFDVNMNYLLWNKKCEEHYGIKKRDLIGKNILEIFPGSIPGVTYEHFKKALTGETVHIPASKLDNLQEFFLIPIKDQQEQEVRAVLWMMHDYTSELQLKQMQKRANAILDAMNEACLELDTNGTIIYANPRSQEFFNCAKETFINKNIWTAFPNAVDTPLYFAIEYALQEKLAVHKEFLSPTTNRWVYLTVTPTNEGIILLFFDIHDFKEARINLEKEHQRFKEAQAIGHIGSFEWNAATNTTYWSDEWYRIHGLEPQSEMISLEKAFSFIEPDDRPDVVEKIKKCKQDACNINFVHRIKRADGLLRTLSQQIQSFADEHGRVTHLSGTVQDITEQVQTKETIQQMLDGSISAICLLDALRDEKGKIIDFIFKGANKAAEVINAMPAEKMVNRRFLELFPGVKDVFFDTYVQVVETGEPVRVQRYYAHEHYDHWFDVSAVKNGDGIILTFHDITEQKKAEADLQKNIAVLQQAESVANMGSWEFEIATGKFNWSEGMYRLFHLPTGVKVTPEIYLDFAMEEDRSVAKSVIEKIQKQHEPFDATMKIKRNKEERLLKIKGSVVQDEKGVAQRVIGVDVDITDIRHAEKKVKESEELLRQTTLATPDAVCIYDLVNEEPFYLNNCLAEWLGYTNQELLDMGVPGRLQLIHADEREKLLQFNEEMKQAGDGEVKTIEYRVQTRNNKSIWVRNRAKVFRRNQAGVPTHILSVLQDFTQEVSLRQQLTERSSYAESLIDASIDRMMVIDQEHNIVGWNKRCEETYHLKKSEAIGRNFFDIFPKLKNEEAITEGLQLASQGEVVRLPVRQEIYTNAFSEIFFIPLKDEAGAVYAVLNVLHDITKTFVAKEELKEVNRTLERKNLELESKNEEITSFAFIASHDLREPLRKIHTFSDWLLSKEEDHLSQQGKDFLQRMNQSVKRLGLLIDDILALTQIHAVRDAVEEVNLNELLAQVKEEMHDWIDDKKAVIVSNKLHVVKGFKRQIYFLLRNLISNAIKFSKDDEIPKLQIKSEVVVGNDLPHRHRDEREYVKLSFIDNGIGIDEKYQKKIFQMFQRLSAAKRDDGTGMGLAMCKKIMENHHGFITVDSKEGHGSVFSCYFPL